MSGKLNGTVNKHISNGNLTNGFANGNAHPLPLEQDKTLTNGQAFPALNGQAFPVSNGQAFPVSNGQAYPVSNGSDQTSDQVNHNAAEQVRKSKSCEGLVRESHLNSNQNSNSSAANGRSASVSVSRSFSSGDLNGLVAAENNNVEFPGPADDAESMEARFD
jgi:hypothetical protein